MRDPLLIEQLLLLVRRHLQQSAGEAVAAPENRPRLPDVLHAPEIHAGHSQLRGRLIHPAAVQRHRRERGLSGHYREPQPVGGVGPASKLIFSITGGLYHSIIKASHAVVSVIKTEWAIDTLINSFKGDQSFYQLRENEIASVLKLFQKGSF